MTQPEFKILVVDDEEPIRQLVADALAPAGVRTLQSSGGEEALRLLEQRDDIDLLLTDLRLPGMAGEELTLEVRTRYPDLPVMIMTAFPSFEAVQAALRMGVVDFFPKPFPDLEELRKRTLSVLEARESRLSRTSGTDQRIEDLTREKDLLGRKVQVAQRNLKEQMRVLRRSREVFYTDLSRVMAILDNLIDGIVFTDAEGKVILINPAAGQMLEMPSFTALGKNLAEVGGNEAVVGLLLGQRTSELPEDGVQHEISANVDGRDSHFSIYTSPIPDFQGKTSGVLSLVRDISLRKKTEHLKNQFLSIVAHELRTPLTTIKAFVTILDRGIYGALPGPQKGIVADILAQADRLGHEIDKIISLGRLEAEDFAPDLVIAPAGEILKKLDSPFETAASEKRITLTLLDDADGALIYADVRDLKRALRALVENALKFTPEGGEIHARATTADGDVVFEVTDTGIGIAQNDHEVIFERFTQLENPLTRKHGGSGLGLSFVREILKAHGARVEVQSELGKGATFRFRLPRYEPSAAAVLAKATGTELTPNK